MRPHPVVTLTVSLGLLLAVAPARADEATTLVYPPFGHCLGIHRVTDFHRFIYLGTRTELSNPTGISAVKLRAKDDPATESDDDELTVFGLNAGRCEIIFNTSIYEASLYGSCGSGVGEFREPLGIAADEEGNVFVADTGNDRVVRLLYENGVLRWIKAFGSSGTGERQFLSPSDVALGASGTLYVCDTGNDRVVMMTGTGEPVGRIEGDDERGVHFERPTRLAVVEGQDPWISRDRDFIVVSDRDGRRLTRFNRDGKLEHSLDANELPIPGARFGALAIDFYGSVYATDREGGRLHKLDRKLRYVTSFGTSGTGDGEFDEPRGISLWRRFGQIFVTERSGAQYLWIGTDIRDLQVEPASVDPDGERVTISYTLTETSRVTLEILDDRDGVVRTLVRNRRRPIGANTERWDGLPESGSEALAPGLYTLRVEATPTYSSGEYFHDTAEVQFSVR